MAESAEHFVDCLYTFNAPDEPIESFKATEDSNKCRVIEYKDGHFHLICLRSDSDQVLTTFLAIYSDYIARECVARPADAFELPKLNRRNDTVIYENLSAIYEQEDAYSEETGESARMNVTTEDEVTLINHETITQIYKYSDAFDMQLLKRLEELTKCTIEVKDEKKEIFVKGDTPESVERMCAKLCVLDQAYSRYTTQRVFNFFNTEKEANFRFQFYRIEKLVDRNIQADHPAVYFEYVELALVKYVEGEWQPHIAPRNLIETGETSVHPWIDYIYPTLGNEPISGIEVETDNSNVHGYLAPEKVLTLTSWTEKVPIRPTNAFEAVPAEDGATSELVPIVFPSRKDYVKSKRVVKGQLDVALEKNADGFQMEPQPPPIEPPHMPIVADVSADEISTSSNIASISEKTIPEAITYRKQGSLIDHPEPITYIPTKTVRTRPISHKANAQEKTDQKDKDVLGDLDECVELRATLPERLQETSEARTRNYRRPPNLKASRTTRPDPKCPSLSSRVTEAMSRILEIARTGYGRLQFDVAIGCIYVERTNLAKEIQTGPFAQADWPVAFQTRSGSGRAQTLFASTLTTSWVDADFLVDLKLKDSTRVFSKTPAEVRVTYLIRCVKKHQSNEVVVEIEPDGKHDYYQVPRTIGSVNFYFPKRVWDIAFGVTEIPVAAIGPQDPIKAVADSFWVRGGPQIILGGQIPGHETSITSIQVRRQSSHQSTNNPDLFLRLTEVQDLIVQHYSPQQFRAQGAPNGQTMDDESRVWWEASISSKVADHILLENRHLELGEVAQWSSNDIIGMAIIEDMFQLAEQVVTRIDSVGYGTKVLSAPQQPPGTARSATKSTMTGKKERFVDAWAEW